MIGQLSESYEVLYRTLASMVPIPKTWGTDLAANGTVGLAQTDLVREKASIESNGKETI